MSGRHTELCSKYVLNADSTAILLRLLTRADEPPRLCRHCCSTADYIHARTGTLFTFREYDLPDSFMPLFKTTIKARIRKASGQQCLVGNNYLSLPPVLRQLQQTLVSSLGDLYCKHELFE
ncbi:hypothetical protein J6590_030498 [Homalodisca vitripennis]|nr:hypothetical protein J6590_030498 [Homalodisca vitripennis]